MQAFNKDSEHRTSYKTNSSHAPKLKILNYPNRTKEGKRRAACSEGGERLLRVSSH